MGDRLMFFFCSKALLKPPLPSRFFPPFLLASFSQKLAKEEVHPDFHLALHSDHVIISFFLVTTLLMDRDARFHTPTPC